MTEKFTMTFVGHKLKAFSVEFSVFSFLLFIKFYTSFAGARTVDAIYIYFYSYLLTQNYIFACAQCLTLFATSSQLIRGTLGRTAKVANGQKRATSKFERIAICSCEALKELFLILLHDRPASPTDWQCFYSCKFLFDFESLMRMCFAMVSDSNQIDGITLIILIEINCVLLRK